MARVLLEHEVSIPPFPEGYLLRRVEDRRVESLGFKTKAEARAWAVKWGHEIVLEVK